MGNPNIRYGNPYFNSKGQIIALHGKLNIGDHVVWLGRKAGGGTHDNKFRVGERYRVVYIYPSNCDVEIELADAAPLITTRAGEDEYQV